MKQNYFVYKFGGTSVKNAERIQHAVELTKQTPHKGQKVVVASALGGVTDRLFACIEEAEKRSSAYNDIIEEVRQRHEEVIEAAVLPAEKEQVRAQQAELWHLLKELLDGIYLLRECSPRTKAAITAMGERLSVPLVSAAFRAAGVPSVPLEAVNFIRTDSNFAEGEVDFGKSREMIRAAFHSLPDNVLPVVTGFIGSNNEGVLTTLGRSGSDYTATILGWALDAETVWIWSDVDGVLTADPRIVPDAFPLSHLSYAEASEMAHFGAKVLHPRTMLPLMEKGIPLVSKNSFKPDAPGTIISEETAQMGGYVKAVTSIKQLSMVVLQGSGMLGIPGVAAQACEALASADINILMLTQASSEQSICFIVRNQDAEIAQKQLENAFARQRDAKTIEVETIKNVAIVAAVGEEMKKHHGIAGTMMKALGRCGINLLAIAQGSSERNISVVVTEGEANAAVKALHEAFAQNRKKVNLVLIGNGNVGKDFIRLVGQQADLIRQKLKINPQIVGITNSRKMYFDERGFSPDVAVDILQSGERLDYTVLIDKVRNSHIENVIIVDTTASEEVARLYPTFIEKGCAIVTPNKRANTLEMSFYTRLHELVQETKIPYLYETTVGAGLPMISTLRDLVRTGDEIQRIEGILSGTLAFVFNRLMDWKTFSEAVLEAKKKGYTEPDPRDDLSGKDMARKFLTLAREMGLALEASDIEIEPLIPDYLMDGDTETFLKNLPQLDAEWTKRVERCHKTKKRITYIGKIEAGKIKIEVAEVDENSPLYGLRETDNSIAFTTNRYNSRPLVVTGMGAGPERTAAMLLADLVWAAEMMN